MGLPGKQRTVQRLVDDHYLALYRYAYRLSGTAADAEDLTQEAFCKAQLNLSQLRQSDRAKPWLFSILRTAFAPNASNRACPSKGSATCRTACRTACPTSTRNGSSKHATTCPRAFG